MKLKGWLSKLGNVKSSLLDKWKQRGTEDIFNEKEAKEEFDSQSEKSFPLKSKTSPEKEREEKIKAETPKKREDQGDDLDNLNDPEKEISSLGKSKKEDSVTLEEENFWGSELNQGQLSLEGDSGEDFDEQAKRFFRVAMIAGVMMMGVFLLSRSVNWFLLVALLWGSYLFLLRRKIQLGTFELGRAVIVGGLIAFLSFYLLAVSDSLEKERINTDPGIASKEKEAGIVNEEDSQEGDFFREEVSESQEEGHQIINLFIELENYSRAGFEVGKVGVENDLLWTSEQANLLLNEGMSVTSGDTSREAVKEVEAFFEEELGWNQKGAVGLVFVAPAGSREVGYASTSKKRYPGVMCIIDQNNPDKIKVKCGFGPKVKS